jgi:hypothetical protein
MPAFTAATITAVAAVAGAATAAVGTLGTMSAQQDASKASKEAEALRKQQKELYTKRRMNALMRQAAQARAQSIAAATSRGATFSSVAQGGVASIQSQAGANILAESENIGIGRSLFDINAQYSEAKAEANMYGQVSDFGKSLFSNSQAIGQIGSTVVGGQSGAIGNWETTWTTS